MITFPRLSPRCIENLSPLIAVLFVLGQVHPVFGAEEAKAHQGTFVPSYRILSVPMNRFLKDPNAPSHLMNENLEDGVRLLDQGRYPSSLRTYDILRWLQALGITTEIDSAILSSNGMVLIKGSPNGIDRVESLLGGGDGPPDRLSFALAIWEWGGAATADDLAKLGWKPESWLTPTRGTLRLVSLMEGQFRNGFTTMSELVTKGSESPTPPTESGAPAPRVPPWPHVTRQRITLEGVIDANGDTADMHYAFSATLASGETMESTTQAAAILGLPVWIFSRRFGDEGRTVAASLVIRCIIPPLGQLPAERSKQGAR